MRPREHVSEPVDRQEHQQGQQLGDGAGVLDLGQVEMGGVPAVVQNVQVFAKLICEIRHCKVAK